MVKVSKRDFAIIESVSDISWLVAVSLALTLKSIVMALVPNSWRKLKKLDGEVVLVTGGARGIGQFLALKFAQLKATIVIWDVNAKGVEETVKQIRRNGGLAYGYTCDLRNREEIYRVAAKVTQEVGEVTILINNAGVLSGKFLLDIPDYLIQNTFDVNVLAHFWTVKAFLPKMIENNHGHIVTIASMGGLFGVPKLVDYCSSKFAAVGFDEALRIELEKLGVNGVKTTLICPYFVLNTGMIQSVTSRFLPTLKPSKVADKIVEGVQREKLFVPIPGFLGIFFLKWIFPWEVASIMIRNIVPDLVASNPDVLSLASTNKRKLNGAC